MQNFVERAVILCDGDTFRVDEGWLNTGSLQRTPDSGALASLAEREKEIIESALRQSHGRISGARGAAAIEQSVDALVKDPSNRTADLGGPLGTRAFTAALCAQIAHRLG